MNNRKITLCIERCYPKKIIFMYLIVPIIRVVPRFIVMSFVPETPLKPRGKEEWCRFILILALDSATFSF